MSDLGGRRGRVMGMEPAPATQGRASYTMQFSSYAEVSQDLQSQIVARLRGY